MTEPLNSTSYQQAAYNLVRSSGSENYVSKLYLDSRGFLTTGVGFLLARDNSNPNNIVIGDHYAAISDAIEGFTPEQQQVLDIVRNSIQTHMEDGGKFGTFNRQTDYGQLLDSQLIFNFNPNNSAWEITGIKQTNGTPIHF